jgi:hypothetical protein
MVSPIGSHAALKGGWLESGRGLTYIQALGIYRRNNKRNHM